LSTASVAGSRPLHYLSLAEVSALLRGRAISAQELTDATLARIAERDSLGAYVHIAADLARSRAEALQAEWDRGLWRGPLHGVPVAVKDLIDTDFAPTTVGMPVFRDRLAERSATVVERLEDAGAIVIGKLATTEGCFSTHHPDICRPVSPWNAEYWTGASSSGSGIAAAAGLCFGTLGSDTGGSIRLPSSACGVTGVKPTFGRVSNAGVFPLAASMDCVGPMARSAEDAAILLGAIAGHDARDPVSRAVTVPDYAKMLGGGIGDLRLGLPRALPVPVDPEVLAVLDDARRVFEHLCGRSSTVDLPDFNAVCRQFLPVIASEAALAHAETFPSRRDEYGEALAGLLDAAPGFAAADLARAAHSRAEFTARMDNLFAEVDLLLLPAMPHTTPRLPRAFMEETARFTVPFNVSGHPTITLCAGFDQAGMPIGVQLVAAPFREDILLRAGHAFQQRTDWHTRHPG